MRPAVALGAGAGDGGGIRVDVSGRNVGREHPYPRQRGGGRIRRLDVIHPRPVAALALHVVIGRVLDDVPPGGLTDLVSVLAHRVAAVAGLLRMPAVHQAGIGVGVGGPDPLVLVIDVAVAAGGRLVAAGEVADETGLGVRRGVERIAIDDLLVGAGGRE